MDPSQTYIATSIVVLAIVALLVFLVNKNRKDKKPTPLASIAFGFILVGLLFGENRMVGYSLIGFGVILAVADMVKKLKSK